MTLALRVEELTGSGVRDVADIGAGHRWSLHRVSLADGRAAFVKAARAQIGELFEVEAAGLGWLAEPKAAAVPAVLGYDRQTLVLEWVDAGAPSATAAEAFGRELAGVHAAGAATFGAPWSGFIAHLPLDNTEAPEWPRWYAERRLAPYLRWAVDGGTLSPSDARPIDRVIDDIDRLAGPEEPPSRIHGDCWSGNVLWSRGRGWLIDPAAHGGHRETDLAMLDLFGAPHLDRIVAAYREAFPLADGWRERVPLHQLHPLLVHVCLFGGGYVGSAVRAARAALAC